MVSAVRRGSSLVEMCAAGDTLPLGRTRPGGPLPASTHVPASQNSSASGARLSEDGCIWTLMTR